MPTSICPECTEEVYVDADSEQGDTVACDECGCGLLSGESVPRGVREDREPLVPTVVSAFARSDATKT